jgi:hypothetical protein
MPSHEKDSLVRLSKKIVIGLPIVIVAIGVALLSIRWFVPGAVDRRPNLTAVPPLAPVTRSSLIVTPLIITLPAIQDALEQAVPREHSGKPTIPLPPSISNAEVKWAFTREPFAIGGRPDGLTLSSALKGSLQASGTTAGQPDQPSASSAPSSRSRPPGGFPGPLGPPSGFPGPPGGFNLPPGFPSLPGGLFGSRRLPGQDGQAQQSLDQRVEFSGSVVVTARPNLRPEWRLEPNLATQVTISDASMSLMGMRLDLSSETKSMVERTVSEQVAGLQTQFGNSPLLELAMRNEWAKMCRAIPLGAGPPGAPAAPDAPKLWLEVRPTMAMAAQPQIDQDAVTLTVGMRADTRVVPAETKPDCPFPARLEIVPTMDQGRVNIDVPIDIPFSEINRLVAAQVNGKAFPADQSGSVTVTVQSFKLAASGDRLLLSLGIKANERKSWFGFTAEATVHVWGRPVLDRRQQKLVFETIELDVESESAFGALGIAARAAVPYLQKTLAENAVIDLSPLITQARANIAAAIAEFRRNADGVQLDAAVVDLRLAGIQFDSDTLRVIAEADGTVRIALTKLRPQ